MKTNRWWTTSALQPCNSCAQWDNRLHTAVNEDEEVSEPVAPLFIIPCSMTLS